MPGSSTPLRWLTHLAAAGVLAIMILVLLYIAVLLPPPPVHAQSGGLEVTKTLLAGSNVVRVGEVLTFEIRIRNQTAVTIATLPLIDDFVTPIVEPVDRRPKPYDPPLSDTPGWTLVDSDTIAWANVLAPGQQLAPGGQVIILVRLRAVQPTRNLTVVNRARVEGARDTNGNLVNGGSAQADGEARGGAAPVTKTLTFPPQPASGLAVTFTMTVTNQGAADLLRLPLTDTYSTALLLWIPGRTVPPPTSVNTVTGVLSWDDLLAGRTPLRPGEALTITTVYTALRSMPVTAVLNRAEVSGARDEYGNSLERGAAEVPIRILPGPAEPTSRPTTRPRPRPTATEVPTEVPTPTEAPTAEAVAATATPLPAETPVPTAVAAIEPTVAAAVPASLPATAALARPLGVLIIIALAALGIGWRLRTS